MGLNIKKIDCILCIMQFHFKSKRLHSKLLAQGNAFGNVSDSPLRVILVEGETTCSRVSWQCNVHINFSARKSWLAGTSANLGRTNTTFHGIQVTGDEGSKQCKFWRLSLGIWPFIPPSKSYSTYFAHLRMQGRGGPDVTHHGN